MSETMERLYEKIARAAHEATRAWTDSIGQLSDRPWRRVDQHLRGQMIDTVRSIAMGEIKNADQLHEIWMTQRLEDGWKYGLKKNMRIKSHPCLLPRSQLSVGDRLKDDLFFNVTCALLMSEEEYETLENPEPDMEEVV